MSKWTMIYSEPDEHRVFQAEDGRTAIADRSGSNPSNTDDGPLYVAPNTEAEASQSGSRCLCPVIGLVAMCRSPLTASSSSVTAWAWSCG
jgi:hypothetical protein